MNYELDIDALNKAREKVQQTSDFASLDSEEKVIILKLLENAITFYLDNLTTSKPQRRLQ